MNIRVPKAVFENCKLFDAAPYQGEGEQRRWDRKEFSLDIGDFNDDQIAKVRAEFEKSLKANPNNVKIKAGLRDIDICVETNRQVPGDVVIQKLKQLPAIMKKVILANSKANGDRKHLYTREEPNNILQPYLVTSVRYTPTRRMENYTYPEQVDVYMAYIEMGELNTKSFKIYNHICGMTVREILHEYEYYLENTKLRAEYERDFAYYDEVATDLGRQFLASGTATTIGKKDYWGYSRRSSTAMEVEGVKSRVVIDLLNDEGDEQSKQPKVDMSFWTTPVEKTGDEEEIDEDDAPKPKRTKSKPGKKNQEPEVEVKEKVEIPVSMYVPVFHLGRHSRFQIHISQLTPYPYNKNALDNLVLPKSHTALLDALLSDVKTNFQDVIEGKHGGVVVLLQGKPGTGKTLTAEVYAESLERPLYTVQCSQLGLDAGALENELTRVLRRGSRWGAVMLLDEADVYVHERGNDLEHNAIVGVFLRVLEYQNGILFFTTNRGDTVDDAILSRCTARVGYDKPDEESLKKIWGIISKQNKIDLSPETIHEIVTQNPDVSGRDVKNLLKLAMMMTGNGKRKIDAALINDIKVFKPT